MTTRPRVLRGIRVRFNGEGLGFAAIISYRCRDWVVSPVGKAGKRGVETDNAFTSAKGIGSKMHATRCSAGREKG